MVSTVSGQFNEEQLRKLRKCFAASLVPLHSSCRIKRKVRPRILRNRRNCVKLYDVLTKLPGCPEVKIVMTGDLSEDPAEWSQAGHITTKPQRETIKQRMRDIDDPLKIVIVRDMWLTGTDIPCLHTLYVDKPMKGHTLMQAIARVNRIFRDKPGGIVVDFIGFADELKAATKKYTQGGGTGNPAPNIDDEAKEAFLDVL